jgi:nucleoside-diphosphate-sugar epimerase
MVRGLDAIVHVAQPPPTATEAEKIDYRTRCTYNLLKAAARERVRRLIYLSSLRMMTGYDEQFEVAEDWRPLPTPEPDSISHFLGEFVCREFAREGKLDVIILRLGTVVRAEAVSGKRFDPLWVDERDMIQAVSLALNRLCKENASSPGFWSVLHILSQSPHVPFSVIKAKRLLGYKPRFNWEL